MEERIQVHHNYISTISNREHKKDLINRLKRSNPRNIPAYEAEMTHHMIMHDDVLGRILTILKQDDYYRMLEELLVIDNLTAYNDIQLFPELYDTTTITERVTGEADLIERQLRQPGTYPLPKTPLPSTLGFVPRPTPTFQPITPDMSSKTVNTHHTNNPQSVETSPGSSLPCGQQTPRGSTSTNSTPSQHTPPQSVVPPQPATSQSPNPSNTPTHTQSKRTPQPSSPTQLKQQSPIETNTNLPTQPSIPATEAHQPVSSSPPQHIPKSANGEGVKNSKTATRPNATNEQFCFQCKQPGHLKKDCPEQLYCSRCRTRGHVPTRCPSEQQDNRPDQEENSHNQRTHREERIRTQDQPQFSHINNRCLHCAGDHQSCDCPTRQQHQANTTSNSASGPGIYQNINKFANTSRISPQSQSTIGITTPTLPVTNPSLQHNFQHPLPINPQLNYQAWPPHFQQFTQPQAIPLQTPPQPFNPQIPPPYFPQYPPSNSPSAGSNNSSILAALQKQWEKQEILDKEHFDMERQMEERKRVKEEWEQKKEEQKRLEK